MVYGIAITQELPRRRQRRSSPIVQTSSK